MPSSISPAARRPQTDVFSLYLLFRAAQLAAEGGELSSGAYDAFVSSLTRAIEAIWARMFPVEEPEALGWMLQRLDLLVAEEVLSAGEAERMKEGLARRAGRASPGSYGVLGLLWRLHVMYRELLAAMERKELGDQAFAPLRAALHEQAMRALREAVAGPSGGKAALAVIEQSAAEILGRESGVAALSAVELEAIRRRLLDAVCELGGADRCGVCGESFDTGVRPVCCSACQTPHHRYCWEKGAGCGAFGCGCVTPAEALASPAAPRFELAKPRAIRRPAGPAQRPRPREPLGGHVSEDSWVGWAALQVLWAAPGQYLVRGVCSSAIGFAGSFAVMLVVTSGFFALISKGGPLYTIREGLGMMILFPPIGLAVFGWMFLLFGQHVHLVAAEYARLRQSRGTTGGPSAGPEKQAADLTQPYAVRIAWLGLLPPLAVLVLVVVLSGGGAILQVAVPAANSWFGLDVEDIIFPIGLCVPLALICWALRGYCRTFFQDVALATAGPEKGKGLAVELWEANRPVVLVHAAVTILFCGFTTLVGFATLVGLPVVLLVIGPWFGMVHALTFERLRDR